MNKEPNRRDNMKKRFKKAFGELKKINAPVIENSEGSFNVSAENNVEDYWADFYGEFGGGFKEIKDKDGNVIDVECLPSAGPYINSKIENIISKYGLELEWECAGYLTAY